MAVDQIDGFEHGLAAPYANAADTGTGVTYDTAIKRSGSRALRCTSAASQDLRTYTLPSGKRVVTFRGHVYVPARPTLAGLFLCRVRGPVNMTLRMDTGGAVVAQVAGGANQTYVGTLGLGAWHAVDIRWTCPAGAGTGTVTMEWRIDGVAQTAATLAGVTLADIAFLDLGNGNGNASGTVLWDDVQWSYASADYPLAPGSIELLTVSGTGTHAVGSGAFQNQAAAAIANGDTTAGGLVDEVPPDTGTDYIAQTAIDAAGYVELLLSDAQQALVPTALQLWAVVAGSATGTNVFDVRLRDTIANADVAALAGASTAGTAQTALRALLTAAGANPLTVARVNGLRPRFGYASDVTPNPRLHGLVLEVMYGTADDTSGGGGGGGGPVSAGPGLKGFAGTSDGQFHLACGQQQIGDKFRNYTVAEVEELARWHDVWETNVSPGVLSNSKTYPYADDFKAAQRPNGRMLLYEKSIQTTNGNLPDAWYAKNAQGVRLFNDLYNVWVMNPWVTSVSYQGAAGWYAWWLPQVVADLDAENQLYADTNPFDGVMGDSMGKYMYTLDGGPVRPGTTTRYTFDDWSTKVWEYASRLKALRPSIMVMHNGSEPDRSATDPTDHGTAPYLAGRTDMILKEGFGLASKAMPAAGSAADSLLRQHCNMAIKTQRAGTAFWCGTEVPAGATLTAANRARRWTAALYLLSEQGSCFYEFHRDGMDLADVLTEVRNQLYQNTNLGAPSDVATSIEGYFVLAASATNRAAGGLYRRRYTNGLVLVNSSASTLTYPGDGRTYFNLDGTNAGTRPQVGPAEGLILLTDDVPQLPPVLDVAPAAEPAIATAGVDSITCDNGSWLNGPDSYSKQWLVNPGSGWVNIAGQQGDALAPSVTASYADGTLVRCDVTAHNPYGNPTASSNTVTIRADVPDFTSRNLVPVPLAGSMYLGEQLYQESRNYTPGVANAREGTLGRSLAMNVHDYNMAAPTSLSDVQDDLAAGRIPIIRPLGLNDTTGVGDFPGFTAINAGTWDAQLQAWAELLAGLATPVIVVPWRRPNAAAGTLPWSGQTASAYIAAWARFRNALIAANAGNVTLLWEVDANTNTGTTYYPGDGLVDWIGARYLFASPYATASTAFSAWRTAWVGKGVPLALRIEATQGAGRDTWLSTLGAGIDSAVPEAVAVVFVNEPTSALDTPAADAAAYYTLANSSRFNYPPTRTVVVDVGEWFDQVAPVDTWAEPAYSGTAMSGQASTGQGRQPVPRVMFDPVTDQGPPADEDADTPGAAWVDVTSRVRELSTKRGRQDELAEFEPAEANLLLDNRDGYFDPFFTTGANYGTLRPMRRMRVQWQWGGATRGLVDGYIDTLSPRWPGGGHDDVVVCRVVGPSTVMALSSLESNDVPNELSGERIRRVLAAANLQANVQDGISVVAGGDLDVNALSHAQEVARSEQGQLYDDRNGRLAFKSRHHRLLNSSTSMATFTDADYTGLDPDYDVDLVANDVTVKGPNDTDTPQRATDAQSIARYFRRRIEVSTLLVDERERLDHANYTLGRRAEPAIRYPAITITGRTEAWTRLMQLDIGSRITLQRSTPHGQVYTVDHYIEGIEHHAVPGAPTVWTTSLSISPAELQAFWVLGDPTLGVLDETTRLAY